MYIDKLNSKVSETMYERVSQKLIKEIKQKEEKYTKLKDIANDEKQYNDKNIEKTIKQFLDLENPTHAPTIPARHSILRTAA